jgi:hypothetical protein
MWMKNPLTPAEIERATFRFVAQHLNHCDTAVPSLVLLKVKWSRYRPGVAQRVGRGIAVHFHDRGTRRGWVVSSTPWPHFTPGKDPVPILQEAGWASGPVWTGGKFRPHRNSIPDRSAGSSVAIPTELPGPLSNVISVFKLGMIRLIFST